MFIEAYNTMLEAPTLSGYMQMQDEMPTFDSFLYEVVKKQEDEFVCNGLATTFNKHFGTNFDLNDESITLGSIMGEETGSYKDVPLPFFDSSISQLRYIDAFAYKLFR